jgi:hypothetical protein
VNRRQGLKRTRRCQRATVQRFEHEGGNAVAWPNRHGREHGEHIGLCQCRMRRQSVDDLACRRRVAGTGQIGGKHRKRLRALSDLLRQSCEHRAAGGKLSVERQQEAALE